MSTNISLLELDSITHDSTTGFVNPWDFLLRNIEHFADHLSNATIFIKRVDSGAGATSREGKVSIIGNVARRCSYLV